VRVTPPKKAHEAQQGLKGSKAQAQASHLQAKILNSIQRAKDACGYWA